MTSFGAFWKTSKIHSVVDPSNWKSSAGSLRNWSTLLGGALGVLLLSASTQANPLQLSETPSPLLIDDTIANPLVEDGIYFYGEASEANEIGAGYMVFEAQGTQVVGAIFMPHSSFDCFVGEIGNHELSLLITNSYTQEIYEYAIALIVDEPVVATDNTLLPLRLDGLFNLGEAGDAEMSMLSTCQTDAAPTSLDI